MQKPTEVQIVAALEQSGYLFEQQVADKLEALGFHVETAWAFLDPDLEKSRELDVRAIRRVLHNESAKVSVFVGLLVECKAFESPMVFLERPKNQRETDSPDPREYIFPSRHYRKKLTANSYQEVPPFIHLDLSKQHYYYRERKKATQFSKIVQKGKDWTANHEGIYDSLVLPLAKAFDIQRREADKISHGPDWRYAWLFFPIVVLQNDLYVLDVTSPSRSVERRNRVSFVRHLEAGSIKGFHLIDFVVASHLEAFVIGELQPFVDHVSSLASGTASALLRAEA